MTPNELRAAIQSIPAGHLRLRVALDLAEQTQEDVADRIGVSQSTMSRFVNGVRTPDESERKALARALRLSVEDIFGEGVAA